MKIGFILPANCIAGGVYVVYHHANYLHSIGHDVTIIFVSDANGLEIKSMQCEVKTKKLEDVISVGTSYDVVIATWWETYYEMFQVKSSHYMYFCQSDEKRFYPSKISYEVPFVEHTYLNKNVGVITIAKWIVDWLQYEYGITAEYAPNGIDIGLFNPDVTPLETKKDKIRILIEGPGSVFFKRIDLAFRVANRFSDIEIWYVCSDGYVKPEWKFNRMFSGLALHEMPSIYASCDILLKLSVVEGFFGPPLEMMACGGTAVVTKVSGYDEYIRHEENALLVEIDDEEGAYNALKRLLEDHELRCQLSKAGIQTAIELSWTNRSHLFLHAIQTILCRALLLSVTDKNGYILTNQLRKLHQNQIRNQNETQEQLRQIQEQLRQIQEQLHQTQEQLHQTQEQLHQTQEQLQIVISSKAHIIGNIIIYIPRKIYRFFKHLIK